MDINEFKKYAIPRIEAGKIIDVIHKTIKDIDHAKQDRYELGKEMYKPITEQLEKEVDEISELRKEYVARPAIAQQPEQLAIEQPAAAKAVGRYKTVVDSDIGFSPEDIAILDEYDFEKPSDVFAYSFVDKDNVGEIIARAGEIKMDIGRQKGAITRSKNLCCSQERRES